MSGASGVYSFMDVVATLTGPGGSIDLGYGAAVAEEGISIAQTEDRNMMMIGADGEGMHTLRAGKSGTFIVHLLKTSPTAKKLQNMFNLQSVSASVWGQNIITMEQTTSGDKIVGRMCAFQKVPDTSYAKDGDVLQWAFHSIKIDIYRGQYPGIG